MTVAKLAIIGGSGLDDFDTLENIEYISKNTPYGAHSAPIFKGELCRDADQPPKNSSQTNQVIFLPRHGANHKIAPHLVNYRANIWVLRQLGIKQILACSVVGGISEKMPPGTFVVPDQIIDYTYGREQTFFDGHHQQLEHTDFTEPYSHELREQLLAYLRESKLPHQPEATYGCTQGPRLETAAEVRRLYRDGCDIVGMTAMPEAALAREMGMEYVGLSLVVNWAAGIENTVLSMNAITDSIELGMARLKVLLPGLIRSLDLASRQR